jgi:ribose transport system permease protein
MTTKTESRLSRLQLLRERLSWQDNIVVVALLVLGAIFTMTSEYFLTPDNLINIMRQTAIVAVLGTGMTFAIISAEIDISIGGITGVAGMLAAMTISPSYFGLPWWLGIAVGIAVGIGFGLLNGLITVRIGIPSFLVTLGMLGVTSGLALILTDTKPVRNVQAPEFFALFSGQIGPIPIIAVWAVAVVAVGHIVLSQTKLGRHIYATGDDAQAARYTGVDTDRVKILTLTVSGLVAGIAGLLLVARLNVARPTMGAGLMLPAIAAVILGGTSLFGGRGWIPGTILGALLMSTIDNGLVLNGFGSSYQELIRGAVIIIAVALRTEDGEGWISG